MRLKRLLVWLIVLFTGCLSALDLKDYAPSSNYVEHSAYIVKFNPDTGTPLWTVHAVRKQSSNEASRQGISWRKDPSIKESLSGNCYKGLDYDAGHFVPADDVDTDLDSLKETFYTSNCAPQNKSLNRGTWRKLEILIRKLAEKHDIVVVTGAVYPNKFLEPPVPPLYFFKVVYIEKLIICFIVLNEETNKEPSDMIISISDLEIKTKLKFVRTDSK